MDKKANFHHFQNSFKNYTKVNLNSVYNDEIDSKNYRLDSNTSENLYQKYLKLNNTIAKVLLTLFALFMILLMSIIILNGSRLYKDKSVGANLTPQIVNVSTIHVVHHVYHHLEVLTNDTDTIIDSPQSEKPREKIQMTDYSIHDDDVQSVTSDPYTDATETSAEDVTEKSHKIDSTGTEVYDLPITELILRRKNNLRLFNPKTEKSTLLYAADDNFKACVIYEDTLVWTEEHSSSIKSVSLTSRNRSVDVVFENARVVPTIAAMALDGYTSNLYAVDWSAGTLMVVNLNTKYYRLLRNHLYEPCEILLDSSEAKIFVLQRERSILLLEMDGTVHREVARTDKIITMAIDTSRKKLYWIDNFVRIVSSNYNGDDRAEVDRTDVDYPRDAMTVVQGHLVWFYAGNESRVVGGICDTSTAVCDNQRIPVLDPPSRYVEAIVTRRRREEDGGTNACAIDNGGCEHLCLLSYQGRTCACSILSWGEAGNCTKSTDVEE